MTSDKRLAVVLGLLPEEMLFRQAGRLHTSFAADVPRIFSFSWDVHHREQGEKNLAARQIKAQIAKEEPFSILSSGTDPKLVAFCRELYKKGWDVSLAVFDGPSNIMLNKFLNVDPRMVRKLSGVEFGKLHDKLAANVTAMIPFVRPYASFIWNRDAVWVVNTEVCIQPDPPLQKRW
jgi:hypothetical protein